MACRRKFFNCVQLVMPAFDLNHLAGLLYISCLDIVGDIVCVTFCHIYTVCMHMVLGGSMCYNCILASYIATSYIGLFLLACIQYWVKCACSYVNSVTLDKVLPNPDHMHGSNM